MICKHFGGADASFDHALDSPFPSPPLHSRQHSPLLACCLSSIDRNCEDYSYPRSANDPTPAAILRAPSHEKTPAPASCNRLAMGPARVTKLRSNLRCFGKVSKTASNAAAAYVKSTSKTPSRVIELPLVEIENEEKLRPTTTGKRKRDTEDNGKNDRTEEGATVDLQSSKKSKTTSKLPECLQELTELHKHFLTAFSIHCAHNGTATPADMGAIQQSVTRLWKKRVVTTQDLQRMLAIYEIEDAETGTQSEVKHNKCPFKLVILGVGSNACNTVEYIKTCYLDEHQETCLYENAIRRFSSTDTTSASIPLLAFTRGTQTQRRQQKATALREHILNKAPPQAQPRPQPQEADMSSLTIKDATTPVTTPSALKSRTLSLFDRVKAKQTLLASTSTPTAQQVLRKHAIGRIAEVVEILRMRQQQSSVGRSGGRVSFSSKQVVEVIKQSMSVPVGDEEVRACLEMLSRDVPGRWLTEWRVGDVKGVVLEGVGSSGVEVKKLLESGE